MTIRVVLTGLLLVVAVVLGMMGYLTEEPEAIIEWSTESEVETAGFHVYRAPSSDGPYERVTESLIPSSGDPFSGAEYRFTDPNISEGEVYYYQLEELETNGTFTRLPDTVRFEVESGPMFIFNNLNWPVVTGLLGALLVLWLLPSPRKSQAAEEMEQVKA
jgi:hypothetical protein